MSTYEGQKEEFEKEFSNKVSKLTKMFRNNLAVLMSGAEESMHILDSDGLKKLEEDDLRKVHLSTCKPRLWNIVSC